MGDEDAGSGGLVSITDAFGLSKPANTIAKKIAESVRAVFEPWLVKRDAKAKVAALRAISEELSACGLKPTQADIELSARAAIRIRAEQAQQQSSIETVIGVALDEAKTLPSPGAASADTPIDPDWMIRLFERARHVTSQDMLKVWGRVLAQQAAGPGSFGLRTLDTLSAMTRDEAEAFRRLCRHTYKLNDGSVGVPLFPQAEGFVAHQYASVLASAGVMFLAQGFVGSPQLPAEDGVGEMVLSGVRLRISATDETKPYVAQNGRRLILKIGHYTLTTAGIELMSLIEIEPDEVFVQLVIQRITADGYRVERVRT